MDPGVMQSCCSLRTHSTIRVPRQLHSLQGDRFDLDGHALGQLVDGDAGPGRLVREPFLVFAIHLGEVGHVGDEDAHADDFLHTAPSRFQNRFQISAACCRLIRDRPLDQVARSISRDLAGTPDLAVRLDGLAVRPCSCTWAEAIS